MRSIIDLTRRFRRRALVRPNVTYYLWRFAANTARAGRAIVTPPAFGDTRAIARELRDHGIVVGPSDRFLSDAGRRALAAAAATIGEASRSDAVRDIVAGVAANRGKKVFRVDLIKGALRAENPVLKVALDVKLLEIVAAYLGMWPALHSVGAWLNYPTNEAATSSQLWHHDPEDLKLITTFIYLEDVGDGNGPFTCVPGTHAFGRRARKTTRCGSNQVKDEALRAVFPQDAWRVCAGPTGTMIVADTIGFHRGGKPTTGNRLGSPRRSSGTRSTDCPSGRPCRPRRNGRTNRPCSDARSDSVGPRGGWVRALQYA